MLVIIHIRNQTLLHSDRITINSKLDDIYLSSIIIDFMSKSTNAPFSLSFIQEISRILAAPRLNGPLKCPHSYVTMCSNDVQTHLLLLALSSFFD